VGELISLINGQWDEELVTNTFCAADAKLILSIPLREGCVDFMAWHYDPKGIFSVKQAYKLQSELEIQAQGGDAGSSNTIPGFRRKGRQQMVVNLEIAVPKQDQTLYVVMCPQLSSSQE
jgi:hypothetical protein